MATHTWQQRAGAAERLSTLDKDWNEITTEERERRIDAWLANEGAERASACRSCGSFPAAPGSDLCEGCGAAVEGGEPRASAYAAR